MSPSDRRLRGTPVLRLRGTPVLRQVAAYASSDGLVLIAALAQGLVLARVLGPADFGVFSLATAYAALVFTLLDPRAAEALPRFLAEYDARKERDRALAVVRAGYALDGGLAVVGTAVAVLTAAPLAVLLLAAGERPQLDVVVLAALATAAVAPVATARAVLTTLDRLPALTRLQVVMAVLRLGACGVLLWQEPGVAGALLITLVLVLVELASLTALVLHHAVSRLGGNPFRASMESLRGRRREMMRFVVYADASSLVLVLVKQLDVLILGALAGAVEAGYYRLGRQISNALSTPAQSLQNVVFPRLSAAVATGDRDRLRRLVRQCHLAGVGLAVATLLVLPFVPGMVRLVSPEFGDAVPAALVLTAAAALSSGYFMFRPLYLAAGQLRAFLVIVTTTGLLSVVLFLLVSGPHGATGVAFVRAAVVSLAGNLIGVLYARRFLWDR